MPLKLTKGAIHKSLVNHIMDGTKWGNETVKFDMSINVFDASITAHFQVYLRLNSTKDSITPNSKYDIFFCSYGVFKKPKELTPESMMPNGVKEVADILLPRAIKEYERVIKSCGIGDGKHKKLPKTIGKAKLKDYFERGDIRIYDRASEDVKETP